MFKSICIYCGSNIGSRNSYLNAVKSLCFEIVKHEIVIIYGGGCTGLMGALADFTIEFGGKIIGIIPQALVDKNIAHDGLSDLKIVKSMHERKLLMANMSDAFIALPGGLGTLEEFCEVATWTQLGFHKKVCGLLNIEGFYDKFLSFLDHATEEKFIHPEHRKMFIAEENAIKLIDGMNKLQLPNVPKLIDKKQL